MLLGSILSGSATTMNDPVALDRETGCVQMWHCGPGPASWADGAGQCLEYHHTLNRRLEPDASPAGVSSDISFAQGPVTMLRIRGDGLSLFVLEAEVVHGPASPYPGSGGWMGKLRMDGKTVAPEDLLHMMAAYGLEHHYPVMKGHHYSSLREIAAWAGWKILPRIDAREFPVI
jgi:L-fucose isomerase-like protein